MIIIDGSTYDVPVVRIDRKADSLDKYAERVETGALQRELIGIFINYTVQFGTGADVAEYARLWDKITEPVEFHTVTLPDGDGVHTFEGYFAGISDTLYKYKDPQAFYKNLTMNMISRYPTRS